MPNLRACFRLFLLFLALLTAIPQVPAHAQDLAAPLMEMVAPGSSEKSEEKKIHRDEKNASGDVKILPEKLDFSKAEAENGFEWRALFKREQIGFSWETFARLPDLFWEQGKPLRAWWGRFLQSPGQESRGLIPVGVVFFLLACILVLDRRIHQISARAEWLAQKRMSSVLLTPVKASIRILEYTLPAAIMQPVVWFSISLFRAESTAYDSFLNEVAALFLLYRLIFGGIVVLFDGLIARIDPIDSRPLRLTLITALRLTLLFQSVLEGVETLQLGSDVYALTRALLQVTLILLALRLATLKKQVMSLLPGHEGGSRWWDSFRNRIDRHYKFVLGITLGLLVLWAMGYTHAASFLLLRGYSILALLSILVGLQRRFRTWTATRIASCTEETQRDVFRNLEKGINLAALLSMSVVLFSLLGLWPYLSVLIRLPILRTSSLELSVFNVARAALAMGFFVLASRILRPILTDKVYPRLGLHMSLGYAINTIVHYLLVIIGVMLALDSLGLGLSTVMVFFTAFSVGIGFGLQDIARNFVSGFILLFGGSLKKGDWVQVDQNFGRVDDLGGRMVRLIAADNTEIMMPASRMVEGKVTNYTYGSPRVRVPIRVGVHYDSDVRHVEQALLHAAHRHRAVLKNPAPSVFLNEFGDNSVNFTLQVWIDIRQIDPPRLRGELNFHIWDVFKEQGINIPYPQRDIYLKPDEALRDIVRALRGEAPPKEEPPPPARPELPRYPTYIANHDVAPHALNEEAINNVVDALYMVGFSAERTNAIQRIVQSFYQTHQKTLEEHSNKVQGALVAEKERSPSPSPIDALQGYGSAL